MCLICLVFIMIIIIMEACGGLDFTQVPLSANVQKQIDFGSGQNIYGTCRNIVRTDNGLKITIHNANLIINSKKIPIQNINVYTEDAKITVGDLVLVSGNLSEIEGPGNPGEFNARSYYFCRHYYYQMSNGVIQKVKPCKGFKKRWYGIRENCTQLLEKTFLQESEEACAVFMGDRSGIDQETLSRFRMAGYMHILSISGLHISIIGMGIYSLLKKIRMGNLPAGIASMILVLFYCVLTDSSISTVRAVTMFVIMVTARIIGRIYDILSALALSAVLVLIESPGYIHDSGFLLSYSAVFGIAVIVPALQKYLNRKSRGIETISTCLGLQLAMLPVVLYFYGEVSLIGIFLNLIIIPTVSIVIYSSALAVMLGGILLQLGMLAAVPGRLMIRMYLLLGKLPEKIPHSTWIAGAPDGKQILIYYVILLVGELVVLKICAVERPGKITNRQMVYRSLSLTAFTIVLLLVCTVRTDKNSMTMLDVGQGDCCVISTEKGQHFLVDGGSSSRQNIADRVILPYLKNRGIRRITAVFVSHTDEDHVNGIEELLEMKASGLVNIEIDRLVLPDWKKTDETYRNLAELANTLGIHVEYAAEGAIYTGKNIAFHILAPLKDAGHLSGSDANEDSMVMECELDGAKILFTGDIGEETEKALAAGGKLADIDILKAAHHGSKYSSTTEFMNMIRPELSVISCAKKNRYGHPSPEAVDRITNVGSGVEYTMNCGAVTVDMKKRDGKIQWRVRGYRDKEM